VVGLEEEVVHPHGGADVGHDHHVGGH
jgi:hypothetical protein